jgi:transketolase N-terminal domain/subunit
MQALGTLDISNDINHESERRHNAGAKLLYPIRFSLSPALAISERDHDPVDDDLGQGSAEQRVTDMALRRRTVEIDHVYKHRHIPSSLGCLEILQAIYDRITSLDVFILSKGHSAAAFYALLESKGLHPDVTHSHPERDWNNGIAATTGSLGHGLPMAVGLAMAMKYRRSQGKVYVLMGDAECQEGTTWEAINLANLWQLDNLHIYIDVNGCGALGRLPYNVANNLVRLSLSAHVHLWPTVRGKGVSFLEGTTDHVRVLTDAEFDQAMKELTP